MLTICSAVRPYRRAAVVEDQRRRRGTVQRQRRPCRARSTGRAAAAPCRRRRRTPQRPSVWPKSSYWCVEAHLAGDVEHADEAEHRVDAERACVSHAGCELALQQVVDRRPGVGDVAEEVARRRVRTELRHHVRVGRGDRLEHRVVQALVEREDLAVPVLPRVEPLAGRRAPRASRSRRRSSASRAASSAASMRRRARGRGLTSWPRAGRRRRRCRLRPPC